MFNYHKPARRCQESLDERLRTEGNKTILMTFSDIVYKMTSRHGRDRSERNLAYMLRFAEVFPEEANLQTVSAKSRRRPSCGVAESCGCSRRW